MVCNRLPYTDTERKSVQLGIHMDSNSSMRCLVFPCRICRKVLYLSLPNLTFSAWIRSFGVFLLSSRASASSELRAYKDIRNKSVSISIKAAEYNCCWTIIIICSSEFLFVSCLMNFHYPDSARSYFLDFSYYSAFAM